MTSRTQSSALSIRSRAATIELERPTTILEALYQAVIDEAAVGPGAEKHALVVKNPTRTKVDWTPPKGGDVAEIPLAVADLPSYESLGGDATGARIGEFLFADYAEAGQSPNPGMGVWFFRTAYDAVAGLPIDVSIAKHRREWRQVLGLQPVTSPIAPIAPREYSGNLCGVRVPGLPRVPGGAADASLVLSWFYDRYSTSDRAAIRSAWATKGQFDVILSWPDSRVVVGQSPSGFVAICRELIRDGFRPCVMLLSKDFDPHHDVAGCLRNVEAILPLLLEPRVASRICIGWELSLWL